MLSLSPFDLHASSTPPAFILSQDQTLCVLFISFFYNMPTKLILPSLFRLCFFAVTSSHHSYCSLVFFLRCLIYKVPSSGCYRLPFALLASLSFSLLGTLEFSCFAPLFRFPLFSLFFHGFTFACPLLFALLLFPFAPSLSRSLFERSLSLSSLHSLCQPPF